MDALLSWRDDALCAQTDPDMFNPPTGADARPAKKICCRCDVREQCLKYALETNQQSGIWGGLSFGERRRLRNA